MTESGDPTKTWMLEVRPDATTEQKDHFAKFMAPSHR
jgi:hypothetical protein